MKPFYKSLTLFSLTTFKLFNLFSKFSSDIPLKTIIGVSDYQSAYMHNKHESLCFDFQKTLIFTTQSTTFSCLVSITGSKMKGISLTLVKKEALTTVLNSTISFIAVNK